MTKLNKPVSRIVIDHHGMPVVVTLTAEGIVFRRPGKRAGYLLPYTAGETRAQMLAARVSAPVAKKPRRASRGLLRTEQQAPLGFNE